MALTIMGDIAGCYLGHRYYQKVADVHNPSQYEFIKKLTLRIAPLVCAAAVELAILITLTVIVVLVSYKAIPLPKVLDFISAQAFGDLVGIPLSIEALVLSLFGCIIIFKMGETTDIMHTKVKENIPIDDKFSDFALSPFDACFRV